MKNPGTAAVISAVIPGLGQFYKAQGRCCFFNDVLIFQHLLC
jgi:hypothetical protein